MKKGFESTVTLEEQLCITVEESEASMITEAAEVTPRVVRTLRLKKEKECYIQFQAIESSPPNIRSGYWVHDDNVVHNNMVIDYVIVFPNTLKV